MNKPLEERLHIGEVPGDIDIDQPSKDDEIIQQLAALSPLEYDRIRKDKAKTLGVRPATLDRLVRAARQEDAEDRLSFHDIDPYPDSVNPAHLLDEVSAVMRRFIVCPRDTVVAGSLWVAMTWFMDVVQVAPLAIITAPEKRCGKSLFLSLLGKLARRPLMAANITPAALFRCVDAWQSTLLVDETDAFMKENEELRGLLNCGHTRDSAYVVRVVGDDHVPCKFNVWGAKALAGIGKLADTLMDRGVVLELRRRLPNEHVDRLRHAELGLFDELAEKLARFAEDFREQVRQARPVLPDALNDRAMDNWEPLLAIADTAGGNWPTLARTAALKLSGADAPSQSIGTELLSDIHEIFDTKIVGYRITTQELITALCEDSEKPWATYNRGKPISPRQMSARLREYGIHSKNIRVGGEPIKGFDLSQFDETFSRYLDGGKESATPLQPLDNTDLGVADEKPASATKGPGSATDYDENVACSGYTSDVADNKTLSAAVKYLKNKDCSGVADRREGTGHVMSESEESSLLAWMKREGETDQAYIDDILTQCRHDPKAKDEYLRLAGCG